MNANALLLAATVACCLPQLAHANTNEGYYATVRIVDADHIKATSLASSKRCVSGGEIATIIQSKGDRTGVANP